MSYFTADNLETAHEIISRYPRKKSALIPLLHLAQEQEGWVTDDAMRQIAELTEENKDLEATVSSLEIQAQETRETFLRVGHGGQSKHLAGLHENAVIAALENENKDLFYELEKKKSQKWQCTQSLTKSFADAEKLAAALAAEQ